MLCAARSVLLREVEFGVWCGLLSFTCLGMEAVASGFGLCTFGMLCFRLLSSISDGTPRGTSLIVMLVLKEGEEAQNLESGAQRRDVIRLSILLLSPYLLWSHAQRSL